MAGTQLLLPARDHFTEMSFGLTMSSLIALQCQDVGQLTPGLQGCGIISSKRYVRLIHQVAEHRLRLLKPILSPKNICQVGLGPQGVGMLRPQGPLAHFQDMAIHGFTVFQAPHLRFQSSQIELG
eukprot:Skav208385  [mRNA]  locus=scaffold3508:167448:168890:- [translate_table: standard]